MRSKLTGGPTRLRFSAKVLAKYDVKYFECLETGFIQTEEPYWLAEAYSSALSSLDVGAVQRNTYHAGLVRNFITRHLNPDSRFVDFGGGYGLFTRLMRDLGFDYYRQDRYAPNMYARFFDLTDLPGGVRFELATAFEVFEHLCDPLKSLAEILQFSESILFSTEIQPPDVTCVDDWWYFVPETGQHVAFYSLRALEHMAKVFGLRFYSNGKDFHLFTKRLLPDNPFSVPEGSLLQKLVAKLHVLTAPKSRVSQRPGLTQRDFVHVRGILTENGSHQ